MTDNQVDLQEKGDRRTSEQGDNRENERAGHKQWMRESVQGLIDRIMIGKKKTKERKRKQIVTRVYLISLGMSVSIMSTSDLKKILHLSRTGCTYSVISQLSHLFQKGVGPFCESLFLDENSLVL